MNIKKELYYKDKDSLRNATQIINEAALMLNDERFSISESKLTETALGTAGGALGAGITVGAISLSGSVSGLSAAGITSGLAAIGGSMLVGIAILPAAIIGGAGLGVLIAHTKGERELKEIKARLYLDAKAKLGALTEVSKRISGSDDLEKINSELVLLKNVVDTLDHDIRMQKIDINKAALTEPKK